MLRIKRIQISTTRYSATVASEFPSLFDPDGCYPFTQFCDTAKTGEPVQLDAVLLERSPHSNCLPRIELTVLELHSHTRRYWVGSS